LRIADLGLRIEKGRLLFVEGFNKIIY